MQSIAATDVLIFCGLSMCVCVCLLVRTVRLAKTDEPIELSLGV